MEEITFDNGIREFRINGGILRFNPADPNVYLRFSQAEEKVRKIEQDLLEQAKNGREDAALLYQADRQLKELLNWVFGPGNDFEAISGNVNLLAVAKNGRQVITNLFSALEPVLLQGLECSIRQQVDAAKCKASARREAEK